eukprot:CAMPEP_0202898442 /NCGR_PEP_ID=MMETSP1392-20130828/6965_1 /ASSEMBLY_ACC=CAM_ASM_000868 /TAXON_ID=225041 /ORGANISM="Chlamydomonas chlamydogama, Strain SAG 11-48b" /LENGTH=381 /DNA_ID=CAMNT_0049584375 /DNA_START=230 /DNA_END=1371 /DNA_ORIENTATION=-
MARSATKLLLLAALAGVAQLTVAQQTGVFYWCAYSEHGSNFAYNGGGIFAGKPRSYMNLAATPPAVTPACHYNNQLGSVTGAGSGWPTPGPFTNGTDYSSLAPTDFSIAPTLCRTADNWGTDPAQCSVPGYGAKNLFTPNGAPSSYPITYDQKDSCNQVVIRAPLVDRMNQSNVFGQVYIWKDYQDVLFVTVSLNATGWGPTATLATGGVSAQGQWLHSQPTVLTNPTSDNVGSVSVWNNFLNNQPSAYVNNLLSLNGAQRWSCWTYRVNLRQACDPTVAQYYAFGSNSTLPGGCAPKVPNPSGPLFQDISASANLFFSFSFNLTRYSLFSPTSNTVELQNCGEVNPIGVTGQDQVTVQLGTGSGGLVDLYNMAGSGQPSL